MARTATAKLDSAAARKRLAPRAKPFCLTIAPRRVLGYVRQPVGAGRWLCIIEVGRGPTGSALRRQGDLGLADDLSKADGIGVLSYAQALTAAASWQPGGDGKGVTVEKGAQLYVAWLAAEKGEAAAHDARRRLALHVLPQLGKRVAARMTATELDAWKASLGARMKKQSINRQLNCLRACLNFLYERPEFGIESDTAWRKGLTSIRNVHDRRIHHFSEAQLSRLVAEAYAVDEAFGRFVEAHAHTGARPPSELSGLKVRHYHARNGQLEIVKGKTGRRTVTLSPPAVQFFDHITHGRDEDELLLLRSSGDAWNARGVRVKFRDALARAGLSKSATPYSVRHSVISACILRGMPISVVAKNCGTGASQIEKHYFHILKEAERELVARTAPQLCLVAPKAAA